MPATAMPARPLAYMLATAIASLPNTLLLPQGRNHSMTGCSVCNALWDRKLPALQTMATPAVASM
jgi:hypothetical protein